MYGHTQTRPWTVVRTLILLCLLLGPVAFASAQGGRPPNRLQSSQSPARDVAQGVAEEVGAFAAEQELIGRGIPGAKYLGPLVEFVLGAASAKQAYERNGAGAMLVDAGVTMGSVGLGYGLYLAVIAAKGSPSLGRKAGGGLSAVAAYVANGLLDLKLAGFERTAREFLEDPDQRYGARSITRWY